MTFSLVHSVYPSAKSQPPAAQDVAKSAAIYLAAPTSTMYPFMYPFSALPLHSSQVESDTSFLHLKPRIRPAILGGQPTSDVPVDFKPRSSDATSKHPQL